MNTAEWRHMRISNCTKLFEAGGVVLRGLSGRILKVMQRKKKSWLLCLAVVWMSHDSLQAQADRRLRTKHMQPALIPIVSNAAILSKRLASLRYAQCVLWR